MSICSSMLAGFLWEIERGDLVEGGDEFLLGHRLQTLLEAHHRPHVAHAAAALHFQNLRGDFFPIERLLVLRQLGGRGRLASAATSGELPELRAAMAFCRTALSCSKVEIVWRCVPSQAPAMASATTGGMSNGVFNTRRISVGGPRCQ